MSGIFNTINTATKGLMAQQTAIHTTGHNITNTNTPGYSRQRVDLKADLAYNLSGVGQLGTGVKMSGIVRMVNQYVHNQIMGETGTSERFQAKSEIVGQLEIIFNEPSETGLNFNLNEVFDSFQELSKNPESSNAKTVVVEKAKALADIINHMSNQIDNLKDGTVSEIEKNAYDFNSIVDRIDSLNKQIYNVAIKGQVPNDLLDQRDLMLKELSGITEIKHNFDKFGRVEIQVGGDIVAEDEQWNTETEGWKNIIEDKLEMSTITGIEKILKDDGTDEEWTVTVSKGGDSLANQVKFKVGSLEGLSVGKVVFNKKGVLPAETEKASFRALSLNSGKIQGYQESLENIEEREKNLDVFTENMAKAINTVHSDGLKEDETAKPGQINFFQSSDGKAIKAGNIRVHADIMKDSGKVNAGKIIDTEKDDFVEGDGSRALAIARLRNTKLNFLHSDSDEKAEELEYDEKTMTIKSHVGGSTIEGAYIDIVTKVGVAKQHSDQMVDNQEVLLEQLEFKRESTSGVSIDEEVGNLIQFQKAYEANAKMISVLTEMLDVLINRTGV